VKGILYIVSTPIGNLADITFRAVETLRSVDFIAAEDTRVSRILMQHYQITAPMMSYHDFNKERVTGKILERLNDGNNGALITDAGTPCISDPGYFLVKRALMADIPVVPIPGPAAFLTALVASGLPPDRFVFEGFLPRKKGRQKRLKELATDPRTLIFYESPQRLIRTLREMREHWGNRPAAVGRELTKKFEDIVRGDLDELIAHFSATPPRGELVIIVGGKR